MKTATPQHDLQVIGQLLQEQLQAKLPQNFPLKIWCTQKQGKLMILGQHLANVVPEPQKTFTTLEQLIRTLQPEVLQAVSPEPSLNEGLPVQCYLRVAGRKQPYAFHTFTVELISLTSHQEILSINDPEETKQGKTAIEEPVTSDQKAEVQGALIHIPADMELIDAFPDELDGTPARFTFHLPLLFMVLGAAVSIVTFTGTLYAFTRPCVVAACTTLTQAEQLSRASVRSIQQVTTAQEVVRAYQQLEEANRLLSAIPPWSSHRQAAQAQIRANQTQAEVLEQVMIAQSRAQTASEKSQNPPHSLQTWSEVQSLWQEAIAYLEQISQDSPVYSLAQQKLAQYQTNLVAINQRIAAEQRSDERLANAKASARIAEARTGVADTLQSWQLSHITWQVVINALRQIPRGTMAYEEAQQLLNAYEPKLAAARDRRKQEEIASNAYKQALSQAQQAQQAEQQNQWSQAVTYWRSALSNAQQVPSGTSYHNQAQPLVGTYTTALEQAQQGVAIANNLQAAKTDLDRTCAGLPKVCDYTVAADKIVVRVTADYDRTVERSMINAEVRGDYNTQVGVVEHVRTFLRAIAAIGDNAQIPIELYNADGSLFGIYNPSLAGYVPR